MVDQPLVLEQNGASITLSGVRQLLMELTPEQLAKLQVDLQTVVNNTCILHIGPLPSE